MQRCFLKMRSYGINKGGDVIDTNFIKNFNLFRIEALRLWFSDEESLDEEDMMLRLQEIAFYNAGFLARLYQEMPGALDLEKTEDPV